MGSFAIAAMLEELDKRISNEFFVISSNMADMTFVTLLSWEWLQTNKAPFSPLGAAANITLTITIQDKTLLLS